MDGKGYGLMAAIATKVAASEPQGCCTQAQRAAFDAAMERLLWTNPANCILPNNPFTEH